MNPRLWKIGKLNHIAIATHDITKSSLFYSKILGAKVSDPIPQPSHGVNTVFVELGNTKIELLSVLGSNSPIQNFLDKNKNGGMHHICLEVDDIEAALVDLKKYEIRSLDEKPKIGAHGLPVVFLHPKDCGGVLVELEEIKKI